MQLNMQNNCILITKPRILVLRNQKLTVNCNDAIFFFRPKALNILRTKIILSGQNTSVAVVELAHLLKGKANKRRTAIRSLHFFNCAS